MNKLSIQNKIAYGSAGIGDAAAYSFVGTYLMFFLTTVAHVKPALAGTIIGLGSIWDVMNSLIIGFWSDKSTGKMGRRRPFLLVGATLVAISCSFLFFAVDAGPVLTAVYYVIMTLAFWTGFSTFFVPFLALGAEFTGDYTERTKLRSVTYGFNIIGTLIGVALPSILVEFLSDKEFTTESAWLITGTFVGVISAISIYITVGMSKSKDIPRQSAKKEKLSPIKSVTGMFREYSYLLKLKPLRYLLLASTLFLMANTICGADRLYFYTYNLNFSATSVSAILLLTSLMGLFFAPVIMTFTRWLDKRSLLMTMVLGSAILVTLFKFTGVSTFSGALLLTFAYAAGSSAYWQLMPAMIYDICEYDELETGKRREGSIVSLLSVAEALSAAIAMQALGIILQLAGFDGSAKIQTPLALEWVENSIIVIPAAFMVLTVVVVYFYPITKKKFEEIQAALGKR